MIWLGYLLKKLIFNKYKMSWWFGKILAIGSMTLHMDMMHIRSFHNIDIHNTLRVKITGTFTHVIIELQLYKYGIKVIQTWNSNNFLSLTYTKTQKNTTPLVKRGNRVLTKNLYMALVHLLIVWLKPISSTLFLVHLIISSLFL